MNINSIPDPPLPSQIIQLYEKAELVIGAVSAFGPSFISLENPISSLGFLASFPKFQEEKRPRVLHNPEVGVRINLETVEASYLVKLEHEKLQDSYRLEFDFTHQARGLSFHFLPGRSHLQDFPLFIRSLKQKEISLAELQRNREGIDEDFNICSCCQEKAINRGAYPERHPISVILMHLSAQKDQELIITAHSKHAEIVTDFKKCPYPIFADDGSGLVSLSLANKLLQLDLRLVHGLRLNTTNIDGKDHTELEVYDIKGKHNLTLSTPGSSSFSSWKHVCENSPQLSQANRTH